MHSNKHILIVEDEILIAKQLKKILIQNEYDNISIAISYEGALDIITTQNTDLVLLDIKISGEKTGINLAKDLNKIYRVPFIFLTSFNDAKTLEQVVKLKSVGYINKPINRFTLISTINLFFNSPVNNVKNLLAFKNGSKVIQINLNELMFINSDRIYITLNFTNNTLLLRSSLTKFLELIPTGKIIQINRSTVVNLDFVDEFNRTSLRLKNHTFKVSDKYKKNAQHYFLKHIKLPS